jgi:hypothetical protein
MSQSVGRQGLKKQAPADDVHGVRRLLFRVAFVVSVVGSLLIPAGAALAFSDVPTSHWAYDQITYVAETNLWMQDYGTSEFKPATKETRNLWCRSLVKAYAPSEPIDPSITFPDLPTTDPYYRYANVCVKLDWIEAYSDGRWDGNGKVKKSLLDRSLVLAMGGMEDALEGLADLRRTDGVKYTWDSDRGPHMQMAAWLELHFDHEGADEAKELLPNTYLNRDEVAYSLWKAKTTPSWKIDDAHSFDNIVLPVTKTQMQTDMTEYGINVIGYPYIWAGEWKTKPPPGYCCGAQAQGGYDCSGFTWWVLKMKEGGYDSAQFRTYSGWSLPERSSSEMAKATTSQVPFTSLSVGDLMFFSSSGGSTWSSVDHVGIWIGKNWMIHSTGGGAAIEWAGDGWWRDHFVYGRKLTKAPRAPRFPVDVLAGDPAIRAPG